MPQKLIALMAGNKEGPWLHTAPFRKPQLVVKGLTGGTVKVHLFDEEAKGEVVAILDGIYPLDAAKKMKVCHENGSSPGLQCHIIAR